MLIRKIIKEELSNFAKILPAKVISVALDGLTASVQVLGDDGVLAIPVYNVRAVSPGDNVNLLSWGAGSSMSSCALMFGGDSFR